MAGALEGVRVLDLTRILAGPYATMMLADLGAEVIKVEIPGKGDDTRGWGPPFVSGESSYFMSINRNKKSLTLNLKDEKGKAILERFIERSDVVAENFRPGTMEKLGFGYDRVREINPRAVFASVSGFGHTGPLAERPGYDVVIQGEGGVMSLTGEPDGPPAKVGASIGDITAGMLACHGVLAALVARERTGTGQKVDIGMLDGQVALLTYQAGIFFSTGQAPRRLGNAHPSITPYETFECADGFINLGVGNDSLWVKFCDEIERPEWARDPRYEKNVDRVKNHDEVKALLDEILITRPRSVWLDKLNAAGVPCGSINTLDQVLTHPQVLARDMVVEVDHPVAGKTKLTGAPVKLSDTPAEIRTPPPLLGEHTDEVLTEVLGLSASEIEALRAGGVV
ncbi:MAG: CoA transferase [Nitrospinota bacterium]|jgi:crotonobetainyl-CoA:carnitine CoA-transferase CaiB-like acyl-CoA transferase|nr:CoA transferase [Nitrospinota bacterium]MDP6619092.1 CoA transferase [Nitrospinota bacterium]